MTLACGTCMLSMLSTAIPFFDAWLFLLLPCFLLWQFVDYREGTLTTSRLLGRLVGGFVFAMVTVAMLAFPLALIGILAALVYFAKRCNSSDKIARIVSQVVICCFLLSAASTMFQAKRLGDEWQLTRLKGGSPGRSYFSKTAEKGTFSDQQLLEFLTEGDERKAYNAGQILVHGIKHKENLVQVEAVRREIQELADAEGDPERTKFWSRLLEDYDKAVKRNAPSEPENVKETPAPTESATPLP